MKFKQFIEQQNRVKLKVEGKNLERFIKRLIQHRIALLNIKKIPLLKVFFYFMNLLN